MHIVAFVLSLRSSWHLSDLQLICCLGICRLWWGEGAFLLGVSQQWDHHFGSYQRDNYFFLPLLPCQSGAFHQTDFQVLSTLSDGKHAWFLIKMSIWDCLVTQLLTCNWRTAKPCSDTYAFVVSGNKCILKSLPLGHAWEWCFSSIWWNILAAGVGADAASVLELALNPWLFVEKLELLA